MANEVINSLKIHCEDLKTMNRIKALIFAEDEQKNKIFTMMKMLPRPESLSGSAEGSDSWYPWSLVIWGTRSDVYDVTVKEDEKSITLQYYTYFSPNDEYVETLCLFIHLTMMCAEPETPSMIHVEHKYHEYCLDIAGVLDWNPGSKFEYKRYDCKEYARLHDQRLYDIILDQGNSRVFDW